MNGAQTRPTKTERDLFLEALERPTPAERAAFLDEACAHAPSLRAAVEALLRNHKEDAFLESPARVVPHAASSKEDPSDTVTFVMIGERPGDRVGSYKLLQQIGEGGVGVVFMAEQEEPLRRRVALKVLKPGMDTKSVIARFESERQALALMDHPNIAKVLDAGSTATGRPYFVMELVRGIRITEYCDQNRLPTRERLALVIQVCQAIQHAHQKGIIHRDIKPSNLLVTSHDGAPVPKVIDFGIAKAIDQRLTDKTFFTEFQSFMGTPAYMSPEQAEMSGLDVDTRTDIYSLGVLLYEMLSGKTPFDAQELVSSGLDGMRRTIREREPSPPSTRFRTLPEAERTTTAHRQQAEPARLTRLLRGDLDWIVLKALEKDRTRRYATANGLAQDLRRYLDNEPILARPPSATYRFQKLVRRNKLVFAGAGAVAIALLIGLAFSTWQFIEKSAAYRRTMHAEQEQSRLRVEAEAARRSAEAQARTAQRQAYAADMNLVQQALAVNNLGRAQELLNRHRPNAKSDVRSPKSEDDTTLNSQPATDLRDWEWRYLWQQCQSDALFTLCQLSNEVSALSVSHDDKWVAVGEYGDRGISIWDLRARQEIARFQSGEGGEPFAFSPAAPLLAFCSADRRNSPGAKKLGGQVRLWDAAGRRIVGELPVSGAPSALAFSADGTKLLTAGGNTEFTIWNVAEGSKLTSLTVSDAKQSGGRFPWGSPMTVTRNFSLAAQAIGGGRIRVVDLTSGRELWTVQAADENVTALAFSPDGKRLASGAGFVESAVRLWDVGSGREVARLEGHRTYVRALVFWPSGETLASASGDQTIHLWDVRSLGLTPALSDSPGSVSARFESQLLSHQARPRVPELRPYATLRGHRLEVWSLALCPDNTTLVSGCKDGSVCVWDTATLRRDQAHVTLPVPVRTWSFLPDGQAILALDEQGRVARWQGVDFQHSQPLLELGTNAFAACLSGDGRFLATVSTEGTTQVWDVQQGDLLREIAGEEWELPMAFLARSNHLVTQQVRGGSLRQWDVTSGREIRSWRLTAPGFPWKSVFSHDEQWLVHSDSERTGQLRHLATGRDTQLDLKQVSGAAFSPDGRSLAAVSVLGVGQIHDTATGRKTATLQGFLQGAHSVTFSPDGQRLAIGSNGNEAIKLWDVESLQELLTLKGTGSMFNSVTFSPDGNVLTSGNSQGILHIWRAPSFEDIARVEAQSR
ncbi:MAG: protein kinase [Chloroflexi bacterium]|nr:protein kinase [Chloroflexota bacterium]